MKCRLSKLQIKGSVKEPNISIYFFFFHPSLNGVLFPMFCLLVEGECQIYHISADVQRITLNASSCKTISGRRTEQLDIIAGFLPRRWLYE